MDIYKSLRLPIILYVEHGVVVKAVGFQSGEFQFETYEQPILDFRFMEFMLRIS